MLEKKTVVWFDAEMKILYTSDIHANHAHLAAMLFTAEEKDAETIIIGGDIVPHHLPDEGRIGVLKAQELYLQDIFIPALRNFKEKRDVKIFLDLSNDDFKVNRFVLEEQDDRLFHLLHQQKKPLTENIDVIGYMNVPLTPYSRKDWEKPDLKTRPFAPGNQVTLRGYMSGNGKLEKVTLNPDSEDTIEKDLDDISQEIDKPFIFVAHSPPFQTPLDVIYSGLNVGSLAIRNFIEKWADKNLIIAALHGHIHESPLLSGSVSTLIGETVCINPGQGSGEGSAFQYVLLDLDEQKTKPAIVML